MTTDTYNPDRDITPNYLATVDSWIAGTGEVLVIVRYLWGGGAKDYSLVTTPEMFRSLINACPKGADIIVMRDPQLPLRGIVDNEFIQRAKKSVGNDQEYMFVCMMSGNDQDPRCRGGFDIGHAMLEDDLSEEMENHVAFGPCPEFIADDNESMVSASKGGIDGPR